MVDYLIIGGLGVQLYIVGRFDEVLFEQFVIFCKEYEDDYINEYDGLFLGDFFFV